MRYSLVFVQGGFEGGFGFHPKGGFDRTPQPPHIRPWYNNYCPKQEFDWRESLKEWKCTFNTMIIMIIYFYYFAVGWRPEIQWTSDCPCSQYSIFQCHVHTWYGWINTGWDYHARHRTKVDWDETKVGSDEDLWARWVILRNFCQLFSSASQTAAQLF